MTRVLLTGVLLAAVLGGQRAFAAERPGSPSQEALDRLVPADSGVDLAVWHTVFQDGRHGGHAAVKQLAEARNWPALRAVVEHGRDDIAVSWALAYHVGYEPRWTAGQVVRRVREWLRADPEPPAADRLAWFSIRDLDLFMASRDRRAASGLAAELMASRSPTAAEAGCRLAGLSGDRELARQLVGLLDEPQDGLSAAAAGALARLRLPAPLPGVTDRQIVEAIRAALGTRDLAGRPSSDGRRVLHALALPGSGLAGPQEPAPPKEPGPGPSPRKEEVPPSGPEDAEAREQIRRSLRIFDNPAQMDLNWGACLTATTLGLEREACRTARMLLLYDYERPGFGDLAAWTAAKFRARELVPELAAGIVRSDAGVGTRIWALGEIGDPAAGPTLAEVGLDPRWVVEVTSSPDAFREGAAQSKTGWRQTRLLVDVTAEALEKITGHRVAAKTPEELAAGWKKWCAANRRKF